MESKMIKCYECKGEGKVPHYDHVGHQDCWYICDTCNGAGTIPDPDQFVNVLSDLVTTKEKSYDE